MDLLDEMWAFYSGLWVAQMALDDYLRPGHEALAGLDEVKKAAAALLRDGDDRESA